MTELRHQYWNMLQSDIVQFDNLYNTVKLHICGLAVRANYR